MKTLRIPLRIPPKPSAGATPDDFIALRTKARAADRSAFKKILLSSNLFYPYEIDVAMDLLDDQIKWKGESLYIFLFADRGKEAIGYVCYGPIVTTDNRYDLYWIGVRKDMQGRGIGSLLLSEAERRIAGRAGKHIYVETSSRDDYAPTRSFYRSNGYREVARVPHYYKEDDDMIIMMKTVEL
jgi:ribosomal protein S18 acetylase RimI-like enzyme